MSDSKVFLLITFNSVLFYLLAYLSLFLITRLSTAISAYAFNIPAVIYYFDIDFMINGHGWSPGAAITVFGIAPLISMILGLSMLVLYIEIAGYAGRAAVFIIWLIILSLGYCAGELIMGTILNRGFGNVMKYWYILDTERLLFVLISAIVLVFTGTALSRVFLWSASAYFTELTGRSKIKFAFCQFILPYMIATGILQACELPHVSFYLCALRSMPVLIFLPFISFCGVVPDLVFTDTPVKPAFSKLLLAITLLALLGYRVVFGIGLRLG